MEYLKEKSAASRSPETCISDLAQATLPGRYGAKSDGGVVVESFYRPVSVKPWVVITRMKVQSGFGSGYPVLGGSSRVTIWKQLSICQSSAGRRSIFRDSATGTSSSRVNGRTTTFHLQATRSTLDTVLHNRVFSAEASESGDSTSIFMVWAMLGPIPDTS
jgi:hypothetical protein